MKRQEKLHNYPVQTTTANKKKYLDFYRVIGMFLVMLGHFVGTGAYAYDIPNVINGTLEKTILNSDNFLLLEIDGLFYSKLGIQTACLGVVIFFISTGYLVAGMMERYSPIEFIINRILRVFPCLIVCVLFNGIFLYFSQGFVFEFAEYLTSITISWAIFKVGPIMGVLWTLAIEVLFYIVAALLRQFNASGIIGVYSVILLLFGLRTEYPSSYALQVLTYNGSYICVCLLGSVIWITEKMNENEKYAEEGGKYQLTWLILFSLSINVMVFKLYQILFGDSTTYPHVFTHLVPLVLFLILRFGENKKPGLFRHSKCITGLSKLVFPVYLTHVVVGFNLMYYLSSFGWNRYLLVLVAVIVSLAVGWLLAKIIETPSIQLSRRIIQKVRNQ